MYQIGSIIRSQKKQRLCQRREGEHEKMRKWTWLLRQNWNLQSPSGLLPIFFFFLFQAQSPLYWYLSFQLCVVSVLCVSDLSPFPEDVFLQTNDQLPQPCSLRSDLPAANCECLEPALCYILWWLKSCDPPTTRGHDLPRTHSQLLPSGEHSGQLSTIQHWELVWIHELSGSQWLLWL